MYTKSYGKENTEEILNSSLGEVPVYIRVNTTKTTSDELISTLAEENIIAEKVDCIENALMLNKQGSVENLKAFKNGLFHVQDLSSQLCCSALCAKKGEKILDVCSAPGGKTFTICEIMENMGAVTACDIYSSRVKLINDGAERLDLTSVSPIVNDATVFNTKLGEFDKVLCDVPCSGLGIVGRKPEIKYKSEKEVENLKDIQLAILLIPKSRNT